MQLNWERRQSSETRTGVRETQHRQIRGQQDRCSIDTIVHGRLDYVSARKRNPRKWMRYRHEAGNGGQVSDLKKPSLRMDSAPCFWRVGPLYLSSGCVVQKATTNQVDARLGGHDRLVKARSERRKVVSMSHVDVRWPANQGGFCHPFPGIAAGSRSHPVMTASAVQEGIP